VNPAMQARWEDVSPFVDLALDLEAADRPEGPPACARPVLAVSAMWTVGLSGRRHHRLQLMRMSLGSSTRIRERLPVILLRDPLLPVPEKCGLTWHSASPVDTGSIG
jgi:hypothetical protein